MSFLSRLLQRMQKFRFDLILSLTIRPKCPLGLISCPGCFSSKTFNGSLLPTEKSLISHWPGIQSPSGTGSQTTFLNSSLAISFYIYKSQSKPYPRDWEMAGAKMRSYMARAAIHFAISWRDLPWIYAANILHSWIQWTWIYPRSTSSWHLWQNSDPCPINATPPQAGSPLCHISHKMGEAAKSISSLSFQAQLGPRHVHVCSVPPKNGTKVAQLCPVSQTSYRW